MVIIAKYFPHLAEGNAVDGDKSATSSETQTNRKLSSCDWNKTVKNLKAPELCSLILVCDVQNIGNTCD
jgi:hypothetical protein